MIADLYIKVIPSLDRGINLQPGIGSFHNAEADDFSDKQLIVTSGDSVNGIAE
jgi:hypothetical protein